VTSVKGYVQLLLSKYKDSDDPFLLKALETVDKQILVLTALISDLLNLSKMKRGGLQLAISEFELIAVVEEIVERIQIVNPSHTIEITKCDNLKISGDRERLGQVVTNFLTNAVKYAPQSKKIQVTCSCDANTITVSVRDYGIGIKEENQQKIFKRFYREEGRDENTFPGFGIGLYIAADIIKKHMGEIGVNSIKGEGATFYFTLPV
jgi:signal transduction histidine kinase